MKRTFTVCIVRQGDKILLGYKKTKIGKGLYNGFGGKVESDETLEEAALRELEEESGIRATEASHCGVTTAKFSLMPDVIEFHVWLVTSFTGEPIETSEMRPQWFEIGDIPYDQMWADDRYWLPLALEGKRFKCDVEFDSPGGRQMLKCRVREVKLDMAGQSK